MIVEAQVTIDGPIESIWTAIADIENAGDLLQGVDKIEILEKPESGLVGLKWRETRTLFGKESTEVMWVTECAENESYIARAESHGFVYLCTRAISDQGGAKVLTMTHESEPQSFAAKLMSIPMGLMFKGVLRKALLKDLEDIKAAVES